MEYNLNNSNSDFQNIIECDFNKHWSWSVLFKNLAIMEQINKLPLGALILEVGSANSYLKYYVKENLGRTDLKFITSDINGDYKDKVDFIFDALEMIAIYNIDLIVLSEVIEHMPLKKDAPRLIENCFNALKEDGILVLTTPTPNKIFEDLVWVGDHEYEFTFEEICDIMNKRFEIENTMSWSVKEREYKKLTENDEFFKRLCDELKGCMSESFIRALVGILAPSINARQTFLVGKKRKD